MHLQPSEFIAKTQAPDNSPQRIATYNMVPGTVVCVDGWEAMRVVHDGII